MLSSEELWRASARSSVGIPTWPLLGPKGTAVRGQEYAFGRLQFVVSIVHRPMRIGRRESTQGEIRRRDEAAASRGHLAVPGPRLLDDERRFEGHGPGHVVEVRRSQQSNNPA